MASSYTETAPWIRERESSFVYSRMIDRIDRHLQVWRGVWSVRGGPPKVSVCESNIANQQQIRQEEALEDSN